MTILTFDNFPHSPKDNTIFEISFIMTIGYEVETYIGYIWDWEEGSRSPTVLDCTTMPKRVWFCCKGAF